MKLFSLRKAILIFACLASAACAVAQEYNPQNGHYYQIVFSSLDYQSARYAAGEMNYVGFPGHLATIESESENDFIKSITFDYIFDSFWVAGFQSLGSAEPGSGWNWADRGPMNYTNWNVGEPNDTLSRESALEFYGDGFWNDTHPSNQFYFIVEFEPWHEYWAGGANEYFTNDSEQTLSDAQAYAETIWKYGVQAHVATLTSAAENQAVYDMFPRISGSNYFLGGYQPDGSGEPGDGWSWLTGEPWDYTNWAPGEPNNFGDEKVLVLRSDGQWNDSSDVADFLSIIELDLGNTISGNIEFEDFEGYPPLGITMEFREHGTFNIVKTVEVALDEQGNYTTAGPNTPGVYDLTVKGTTWLRRTQTIDSTDGDLGGINFGFTNGDADGDNEINLVDYGRVAASFGKSMFDEGFDRLADLNGDDEVNLVDIGIVAARFGFIGDD